MSSQTVADYYNLEQLARKLGRSEHLLVELVNKGLLEPRVKNGNRFFSSHQAHELEVAFRLSHTRAIGLDRALLLVRDMRYRHAAEKANSTER